MEACPKGSLCGGSSPPRQSLHTPIAGKPMAHAIGFPAIQLPQAPHVRGGSVSRRGLNQVYRRKHRHSQAEPSMQKQPTQTPAALRERGVWGERRFSQRSGLSPQRPPTPRLFRREREGGGFSTEKPPPSHPLPSLISFHLQRRGMRGIMQGIMEIKRYYVDSAVSRAIKEDEA